MRLYLSTYMDKECAIKENIKCSDFAWFPFTRWNYINVVFYFWSTQTVNCCKYNLQLTTCRLETSGWAKQNSENSGLFRNFLNAFWLSYPHPHSIGPFLCRKFSLIILCILLFARVHFRISCIYEKDVQKEKVNTGMTRIFRQHKFIAFRYLNVYYKKPKPKLKSLYVLLVSEIFT